MKKDKLIKGMALTISTVSILQIGEVCTNVLPGITAFAETAASTNKTLVTNTTKSQIAEKFKFTNVNIATDAQATLVNNFTVNSDACTSINKMQTELNKYTSINININAINKEDVQKKCTVTNATVPCKFIVSANAADSKKADVKLITTATSQINASFIFTNTGIVLTPITMKSVSIDGTERVGKKLSVIVKDTNGKEITSNLTYKWYRLKKKDTDISDATKVDTESTYKLVSSDKDKYIKVYVTYNGVTLSDVTGSIDKKSSSGGSSSDDDDDNDSSSSNSSSSDNSSNSTSSSTTSIVTAGSTAAVEQKSDGRKILVNNNGQVMTGWQKVNGQWYLADNLGNVKTGWQLYNGKWYLMKNTGIMATGWQYVDGHWYMLQNDGSMATGWKMLGGKWYFLKNDGSMATGWQMSGGKWYYLYADGTMASNITIFGYRLNADGAWIR